MLPKKAKREMVKKFTDVNWLAGKLPVEQYLVLRLFLEDRELSVESVRRALQPQGQRELADFRLYWTPVIARMVKAGLLEKMIYDTEISPKNWYITGMGREVLREVRERLGVDKL